MSILKFLGTAISTFFTGGPITTGIVETATSVIDSLAKTEGDKIDRQKLLDQLNSALQSKEIELTQSFISRGSLFMTGWWGLLAWSCSLALVYSFFIQPITNGLFSTHLPNIDSESAINMIYMLLGMGTLKATKSITSAILTKIFK